MGNKKRNTDDKNQNNSKPIMLQTNTANAHSDIYNRIERCWNNYNLVNGWIEKSDNKVNVSIAIFTAVFGVITFISQNTQSNCINETLNNIDRLLIHNITFLISVIFWLLSILLYLITIFPKLNSNKNFNKHKLKDYPIFFKDVASIDLDQYKKMMLTATDKQFLEELIAETHANSSICKRKMNSFRMGVVLSGISLLFAVVSLAVYFF